MKKLLVIIALILVVLLVILIRPNFIGNINNVTESEKKETTAIGDKKIKLMATDCTKGKLSMTIGNDGNVAIDKNDLKVLINDEDKTANFIDKGINTGEVAQYSDSITVYSGKVGIEVESPSNTIRWGITC